MIQRERERKKRQKEREFGREYFTFGHLKKCHSDCFGFQDILHVILLRKETSWFGMFDQQFFLESPYIFSCLCHVLKERIADPFDKVGKKRGREFGSSTPRQSLRDRKKTSDLIVVV